jgi:UDP-N-acetylmuramate--L-alanine ligase/UDP-N-acetylenolpyruvoylglucosamine reductase
MTPGASSSIVDRILNEGGSRVVVYLVGAGGCGMSGLGHLLLDLGYAICGSDLLENEEVRQLWGRGARIHVGHAAAHVEETVKLVVYSSAVRPDNPELLAARERGIPTVRRAVLLAGLMHRQRGICVAGMHGKTTTTALLAFALERLGANPSYAVGALVPQLVPHARFCWAGPSTTAVSAPWFVAEVDESDGTLPEFHPHYAIILNVDAEHLDHFGSLDAILTNFGQFGGQAASGVIFCADDPRLAELFARHPRALSYGRHPLAGYRAELLDSDAAQPQQRRFQVWHRGQPLGPFQIQLLGEQNISNATAVVALLHQLGFSAAAIAGAIAPFRGAARRQQELYRDADCQVFEDYGHHPNEIRATLRALRSLGPKRLLVAFQPHRYTRTQHLWREFAQCFADADRLWLVDLYPASEPEIPGVNSGFLAKAIQAQGKPVEAVVSLAHLAAVLRQATEAGDLVLFLGAGDITQAAHQFADQMLASRGPRPISPSPAGQGAAANAPVAFAMNTELYTELTARLTPETVLRQDEPLAKRTTLRVGGPADLYAEPASERDLAEVLKFCSKHTLPFVFLGRGSNLLIRDGGIRGAVICLAHPHFSEVRVEGEKLHCGAGARLKTVAIEAKRQGLSGLEFLEGIPGSVGGAMRMNAGAMGSWLFDHVESIRFMDFAGAVHERQASEVNVEYRGCPLFKNHVALGAVLKGQYAARDAIQARMDSFSRKRWESQPSQSSAGCIFKNPKTVPAGRLIDELGLKGVRVGGASVSDVHANFIINDGSATARDVLSLIKLIKERARSARGIELETEVEILGDG